MESADRRGGGVDIGRDFSSNDNNGKEVNLKRVLVNHSARAMLSIHASI